MRFVLLLILLLGIVNIQSLPFFDPNRISKSLKNTKFGLRAFKLRKNQRQMTFNEFLLRHSTDNAVLCC